MLYTCSYRAEINVLICGNANIAKSCNTFFCYLWFALFLVLPSTSEMSKDTPPPLLCSRWRYSHKPLWSSCRCQRQARQELLDSWEDLPHTVKPQICGHPQSEWNHSPLPVEGFCYSGRRGSAEAEVCLKDSFQQDTLPKGKTIIWSQGVLVLLNGLGQGIKVCVPGLQGHYLALPIPVPSISTHSSWGWCSGEERLSAMTGFPQRANLHLWEPQTAEVQRSLGYRGSMRLRKASALINWDCIK